MYVNIVIFISNFKINFKMKLDCYVRCQPDAKEQFDIITAVPR